ncbi:phosphoribosylglycinamide formyltransferase [Sulfurimonas sp. SAG-AH-194-I05]|nr:formyltransferase family protein [Sulfurimonas sp. SAG-AH-194-I05]MDF1874408.1 phosphoribosylglycinamide formyltransferase [Sulfurimonas sp. SAG-AH-194-I05]
MNIAILASYNASSLDTLRTAIQDRTLDLNIVLVISNNSNAVALQKAKDYKIKNYLINTQNTKNPEEAMHELLKQYNCDYVLLAGYMKKISSLITNNFKVLNSHPSLLPKYGGKGMYGKFVHEAVIKNNETTSGVTVHEVNEKYDDGKIIIQKKLILASNENAQTLEKKIKQLEQIAVVEAFQKCLK